nr:integrase, catalytic region, zinc finger, CCHC-type, peptidase aspartic, catalytic [Tanacetum cinerariifolium]
IKSATGASKPASKSNAWIYRKLSAKMNRKQPKAKNTVRTTKKVWRPKVVTSVKPMWKPTRRHFTLDGKLVVQIVLWYLDSGCSRHMTDDRSKLINYVEKFIGTVRFKNDQFAKIVGYGDYKLGNTIISRVYYVEGLNHNLFPVGQFCDEGLEVTFKQHTCYIRNMDKVRFLGTKVETPEVFLKFLKNTQRALNAIVRTVRTDNGKEFVNKTLTNLFESVGITHQTSVHRSPQQNGVVERRNRTLMEAARIMLIFEKAPLFRWVEAIAIACYTLNRSLIHTLHEKTYYELLKGKNPDLKYFRVFGSLCYPTNDYDDVGKLKAKANIGLSPNSTTFVQNSTGLKLNVLQSGRTSSDLVKDPPTPSVSTTVQQFDELFQPWIDEDEEFPPTPTAPVNAPAVQAPEIAIATPS